MTDSLLTGYAAIVCDLDGVVYHGGAAVDGAVRALTAAAEQGRPVVYATNNASRTPQDVAAQLRGFGLELGDGDVITSSQAGAAHLSERLDRGRPVLAVGGSGVAAALRDAGLAPVSAPEHESGTAVDAVLQGYGPDVSWRDLAQAARAVQAGAVWVVTNTDRSLPTERGPAPGNGTLVAAVRAVVDHDPEVIGKPFPPLYERAAASVGVPAADTLAVGDRLDTDIAGAGAAHMDALLVLTGVHGVVDVALAPPERRPRYVAADLAALHGPYEEPHRGTTDGWCCGSAHARLDQVGGLVLAAEGHEGPLAEDGLRAGLACLWDAADGADAPGCDEAVLRRSARRLERWWAGRTGAREAVPWAVDDEEDRDGR